jgi:glutamate racemase
MISAINDKPIGVFDSGVGGLTVVKSILKVLPNEKILYYGDTARVPYGNKSSETIKRFSTEIMDFLTCEGIKLAVVACNTASSLAIRDIKDSYDIPVIGVIEPGVKEALRSSRNKRIGVIGTRSTVKSGAYENALKVSAPEAEVFSKDCPLFVPLVENRMADDPVTEQMAERYLGELRDNGIDTLILGCTHYPILMPVLSAVMKGINLVDSPSAVVKEIAAVLEDNDMKAPESGVGGLSCFVSDDVEGFKEAADIFLEKDVIVTRKVL